MDPIKKLESQVKAMEKKTEQLEPEINLTFVKPIEEIQEEIDGKEEAELEIGYGIKKEELEEEIQKAVKRVEYEQRKVAQTKKKLDLIKGLNQEEDPSLKKIKKVMSEVLCFGDLAYCCRTLPDGKYCPFRNSLLHAVGLTKEDFEKIKEKTSGLFQSQIENYKLDRG